MQSNSKEAFARAEQQLKTSKNPAALNQLLGQISFSTKDYAKAIEHLEKAVNQNPELTSACYMIGSAYAARKGSTPPSNRTKRSSRKILNPSPRI